MSTKKGNGGGSDPANDEGARSFSRALEMIDDGGLVIEASRQLHNLLTTLKQEVDETGVDTKGELSLTLKITVERGGTIEITPAIKLKEPGPRLAKGRLWITSGANLTPHNPRQQKLPLREVGGEERETREVEGAEKAREV